MDRFEYKLIELRTESGFSGDTSRLAEHTDNLNQAGVEGWELVSCIPGSISYGSNVFVVYVLKRKLP